MNEKAMRSLEKEVAAFVRAKNEVYQLEPEEVATDRAHALQSAIAEVLPVAFHNTAQYANNRVECDHGWLKARLRHMRGLKTDPTARVIIRGHAFMQNLRRGHYELGVDARSPRVRVAAAFDEVAQAV